MGVALARLEALGGLVVVGVRALLIRFVDLAIANVGLEGHVGLNWIRNRD